MTGRTSHHRNGSTSLILQILLSTQFYRGVGATLNNPKPTRPGDQASLVAGRRLGFSMPRGVVGKMFIRAVHEVVLASRSRRLLLVARRFDVTLTNLEMPRIHGYEPTEEVRRKAESKDTPLLVMTTHAKSPSLSR